MTESIENYSRGGGAPRKERNSNLELLRIILMFAIVAHHFVVNSGITAGYDYANVTPNMVFLQLFGMWGKPAINCFVLITGYFMCTSKLTWKRFGKMWLQVKFYKIVLFIVFLCFSYEILSAKSIFRVIFSTIYYINNGFTASFLTFYLFIPFYNLVLEKFTKQQLKYLIVGLFCLFTIVSTFFFNGAVFNYLLWYMTLYFVAAYVRLYPNRFTESKKFAGIVLLISILLSYASVIVVDFVGSRFGFTNAYYMVSDSHKLLAVTTSVSAFLFFKNMKPRYNKIVNGVAATTFGVLLIHANSDAMRQWLWRDLLNVPALYAQPIWMLILMAFAITVGVFIACSIIDCIRIWALEKPLFYLLNKKEGGINAFFGKVKEFFLGVWHKIKELLLKLT